MGETNVEDYQRLWVDGDLPDVTPVQPRSWASHLHDTAIEPGENFIRLLFTKFLNKSTPQQLQDLKIWITDEMHGVIHIGSVCSGTDAVVWVWQEFAAVLQERLSISLQIEHEFSCDNKVVSRDFTHRSARSLQRCFRVGCRLWRL